VALRLAGAPLPAAPLAAALLFLPASPWTRPADRLPVVAGFLVLACAGWAHAHGALARQQDDCRFRLPADSLVLAGTVTTLDAPGRLRVRAVEGLPLGCRATVRVVTRGRTTLEQGDRVRVVGRWSPTWRPAEDGPEGDPLRAGLVLASVVEPLGPAPVALRGGERLRWAAARLRGRVDGALRERLGGEAPLARALVVARRDALAPEVRDAFARSGTAHLLAISGFHVGVVALLALSVARFLGGSRRSSAATGALVALAYAALLGFPDAATRAAILVALVALGRALGRPVLSVGALSSALLALVLVDPTGPGRIGFQLSFAGAFGLALMARPFSAALTGWAERVERAVRTTAGGRPPPVLDRGWRAFRGATIDGVAASTAATLATLPLVAWHFEAVPVLGVLATLMVGPLVAAALPGLLLVVLLELGGLPGAGLPAAGAGGLLALGHALVDLLASVPGASVPVTRAQVVAGLAGGSGRSCCWPPPAGSGGGCAGSSPPPGPHRRSSCSRSAKTCSGAERSNSTCSTSGRETRSRSARPRAAGS
jgi:ComEC/Rec2-related protein